MAKIELSETSIAAVEGTDHRHRVPRTPSPTHADTVALRRARPTTRGSSGPSPSTPSTSPAPPPACARSACGPGDRVVLMMRNIPEFHILDLAVALLRRHADLDLQLVVARAGRVPGRPLRGEGRPSSRTTASSSASSKVRDELPTLERLAIVNDPDGVAGPDVWTFPQLVLEHGAIDLAEAASPVHPRHAGHGHLHVGHHRAAQGRDALPPQRRVDGREPAAGARPRDRPRRLPRSCRTCRWRTSPSA